MNELSELFNNTYLKLFLNNKAYNFMLLKKNDFLYLNLLDIIPYDEFKLIKRNYKTAIGISENNYITFFDLSLYKVYKNHDKDEMGISFLFSNFVYAFNLKSVFERRFDCVTITFVDISDFSTNTFYDYDNNNLKFHQFFYKYNLDFFNLCVELFPFEYSDPDYDSECIFKKKIEFNLDFKSCCSVKKIEEKVYELKIFLSILSKRDLCVDRVLLNSEKIFYINHFSYKENTVLDDSLLYDYKSFVIDFDSIKNQFEYIYSSYLKNFNKLLPPLELYLNILKNKSSNLNRFLNMTQIIEYISKEFDEKNALLMWKKNGCNSRYITLSDRLESLINQLNFIWNMDDKYIYALSKTIANGRNYFNHYNGVKKKLSSEQLYTFSYFLEDIFVGYIYLICKIDTSIIINGLIYSGYYTAKELHINRNYL